MADSALFVGWGSPVRGREARALQVFNESIAYWAKLQSQGMIESFEPYLLQAHGGDLAGFALLKGSAEKLATVEASEEFGNMIIRAGLIVENLGVVRAQTGQALAQGMVQYQQQIADLT
jgi:hypothetical protein